MQEQFIQASSPEKGKYALSFQLSVVRYSIKKEEGSTDSDFRFFFIRSHQLFKKLALTLRKGVLVLLLNAIHTVQFFLESLLFINYSVRIHIQTALPEPASKHLYELNSEASDQCLERKLIHSSNNDNHKQSLNEISSYHSNLISSLKARNP